jgi:SPOR domain
MSEQANKSRFAIDLDDLEKQLKSPAPVAARGGDALAELARIVGRDDPLKGLFAQRQAQSSASSPAPARIEPSFQQAPVAANTSDNLKGALDEFDALLRRDLSGRGEQPAPEPVQAYVPRPFLVPEDSRISAQTVRSDLRPAFERAGESTSMAGPDDDTSVRDTAVQPQVADAGDPIVDPFIDELEQHGRAGLDRPGIRPALDERRVPHDLDEPREAGRFQRPAAEDQLSRDLDEQISAYPLPPAEPLEDMRTLEPRKSRKGLITIAALLGVAAIGVVGATTFRSGPKAPSGEPPVIKAEAGPNKVAPQSPGGTEVPNQNKQIYERGTETKAADTKVVTREEQPLDVAQAARTATRVILPAPAGTAASAEASTAPAASSAATLSNPPSNLPATPAASVAAPGLGEPRKVRTVSIKPDGTAATAPAPANGALAPTPPARVSSVPTMVLPPAATAPQARPAVAAPRPAPKPAVKPAQDDETATEATAPTKITSTAAARAKTQERAGERVATAPAPVASTTADTARETPAATGATGGFAVQLGAPGSEAEARSTFAALQRKYPGQLGGQSPLIRKADVNGREVYRLRVGPMSREGAASLCTQLQGAGGQCFIAKN